ncbi:unnamed protein product [Urochloa humidicola]
MSVGAQFSPSSSGRWPAPALHGTGCRRACRRRPSPPSLEPPAAGLAGSVRPRARRRRWHAVEGISAGGVLLRRIPVEHGPCSPVMHGRPRPRSTSARPADPVRSPPRSFLAALPIARPPSTLAVNGETVKFEIWDTAGQERPLLHERRNGFENFKHKETRIQ